MTRDMVFTLRSYDMGDLTILSIAISAIMLLYAFPVPKHPITENLTMITVVAATSVVLSVLQNSYPDITQPLQLIQYTCTSVGLLTIIRSVPQELAATPFMSKLRFTLVFSTAAYYRYAFTQKTEHVLVIALCAIVFVAKQGDLIAEHANTHHLPVVLQSILSIIKYFLLDFGIDAIMQDDHPVGVQSLAYATGLVAVIGFVISMVPVGNWRTFALWRLMDLFIKDIQQVAEVPYSTLAVACVTLVFFMNSIPNNYVERALAPLAIDLVKLVAGSTTARALLMTTTGTDTLTLFVTRLGILMVLFN